MRDKKRHVRVNKKQKRERQEEDKDYKRLRRWRRRLISSTKGQRRERIDPRQRIG
jgi:hypothetical protein